MQVLNLVVFVWNVKQILGAIITKLWQPTHMFSYTYVNTPPFTIIHTQMVTIPACTSGMSGNKWNNTTLHTTHQHVQHTILRVKKTAPGCLPFYNSKLRNISSKEAQTISHNLICSSFIACYILWLLGQLSTGNLI